MAGNSTVRVFIALWPREGTRTALFSLAQDWRTHCGGRITRRENLHLTLAFIGDVRADRIASLSDIVSATRIASCDFEIDAAGYFRHHRVAWAGPAKMPAALPAVVADLRGRLRVADFRCDERPFVAHVTLLRDARCAPAPVISPAIALRSAEVVLALSEPTAAGVKYRVIARAGGT